MTVLGLPNSIVPMSATWTLEHNVGINANPIGNTIQRLHRDGGRWMADLTFPPLDENMGPLFASYLDRAARGDMWTYLSPQHNDARGNWGPDELVVNGDLSRDLTGWSAGSGAAINVNARRLRVKVGGSPGAISFATQSLVTETDQPHVFMMDLHKGSTANWRVRLLAGATEEHFSYYESEGRVIFTHIPGSTSTTLELGCNSTTEQDYVYFSNISASRCLLVNDSLAVGNACGVKGAPASVFGAIKAGEFVTIQLWNGWQMVRLTEDLDTDSSGNGTLRFEPSLRAGVKGGGAVIVHKPFCRMFIPSHSTPHNITLPRLHGFSVSFVEDVTEIGITENPQDTDLIWYWDAHGMSLAPQIGTGTPTMTNSSKRYFDESGVLKTTDFNTADTASPSSYKGAFDHNSEGALKGQLIEAAGTNVAWPSEDFTHSNYSAGSIGVTRATASISNPRDGTTAGLITAAAGAGYHYAAGGALGTLTAGVTYSETYIVKRGTERYATVGESGGASWIVATFDFDTETFTNQTNCAARLLRKIAGGWYEIAVTFTRADTTSGALTCSFGPNGNVGTAQNYTAAGNETGYWFAVQHEVSAFPTSYIPTTSAAASRSADVDTLLLNKIAGFTTSEYTVSGEVLLDYVEASAAATRYIASLDDATANESAQIRLAAGANTFDLSVTDGGANQALIAGSAVIAQRRYSFCAGVKLNDFAYAVLGAAPGTDTSGTMPTPTTLRIGHNESNVQTLTGHLPRLCVHKTKKPNRQVRSLSA